MPVNLLIVVLVAAIFMAGCGQRADKTANQPVNRGVLGALRPGADPALVAKINEEERLAQIQQFNSGNTSATFMNGLSRILPKVSMDPIAQTASPVAPPAEQVSQTGAVLADANSKGAAVVPADGQAQSGFNAAYTASYGSVPPPPPGALGVGLVPPPTAVTLSTQANAMADAGFNPYSNPYFNPYGVPAPQGAGAVQAQLSQPRPAGLFGSGEARTQSDDDAPANKKRVAYQTIAPSGMDSCSPYKQRDDLKALWKGAIKQSVHLGYLTGDPKVSAELVKIDAGLPSEATKGNFGVSPRQIETIFKANQISDKRNFRQIRKAQTELVQSYYRYLYTYNKYALAQQTLAARKQESELADSAAEQQRAAADISQAQSEMDSAKDDMKAAQYELATASSPESARSVISRISGVAPSIESLAQIDKGENAPERGGFGNVSNMFGSIFRLAEHKKNDSTVDDEASVPEQTNVKAAKNKKEKKTKIAETDKDLTSAKAKTESKEGSKANTETPAPEVKAPVKIPVKASAPANISFTLKGVDISARKSVLTVAIKNTSGNEFNFDPDRIVVSEGNHQLSDAATRADFDTTVVPANDEVKGTITIFGRPWSDRVSVALCDGNKTIQLKR